MSTMLATRLSFATLTKGLERQAEEIQLRDACKAIEARLIKRANELGKPFELELTPKNKRLTLDELDAWRDRLLAQLSKLGLYATTDAGKAAKAAYDEERRLAAEKFEKALTRLTKLGGQLPTDPCSVESLEVLVMLRRRSLYNDCAKLCIELTRFARDKRVPIEPLCLPDDRRMSDEDLLESLKALKKHRMAIETRARDLDPRRSLKRTSNPRPLPSPVRVS